LGTLSGQVFIYSYHYNLQKGQVETLFSHEMILSRPDESPCFTNSSVSCLSFTSDGLVLAAGWLVGGFAIWSLQGHLLTSTFTFDAQFMCPNENDNKPLEEDFFFGVEQLVWGPGNFDLFILPAKQYPEDSVTDVYVLSFAKASSSMHVQMVRFLSKKSYKKN
jgi:WD40 repeat protein